MSRKNILSIAITILFTIAILSGCSLGGSNNNEVFSFIYMSDTQADPEIGDYTIFGEIIC